MNRKMTFCGWKLTRRLLAIGMLSLPASNAVLARQMQDDPSTVAVCVTDFLPDGFVADGSVGYQRQIQRAIDHAADTGRHVVFPPITYGLDDEQGLRLYSDMTLTMYGATIQFAEQCSKDGQAFHGHTTNNQVAAIRVDAVAGTSGI